MPFVDRRDAGRRLAERLMLLHGEDAVVVARDPGRPGLPGPGLAAHLTAAALSR